MGVVVGEMEKLSGRKWIYMLILVIFFYGWIGFFVWGFFVCGVGYVGWCVLFGFVVYVLGICFLICEKYGINGNMVEDFFVVVFLYLFVVY